MLRIKTLAVMAGFHFAVGLGSAGGAAPAFPGAKGFGAVTPGGRGGRVLKVTNLDDAGPGSFREACRTAGPRTIIFDVAGYIGLKSDIEIRQPFCTIAGQTAPGGGVCVRGAGLVINTHDVVIRHMRFRLGEIDPEKVEHFRDCVHIAGQTPPSRIILDHCSLTWAVSRNLVTWSGAHDITVQWCLIAQPLRRKENDGRKYGGMGFLVGDGTKNISVHHALFAHQYQRNPRLKHGVRADLVNNVIYNWGSGGAAVMGDFGRDPAAAAVEANLIHNWFQAGPDTPAEPAVVHALTSARLYAAGNITNHAWLSRDLVAATTNVTSVQRPWPAAPVTTHTAEEAYPLVLEHAGATRPRRDAADQRIVETVRAGAGGYVGSEHEAGGWPDLAGGSVRPDRDSDGLPDEWETAAGLDPDDATDGAGDRTGDGYTNLEEWLNALAAGVSRPDAPPEPTTTEYLGYGLEHQLPIFRDALLERLTFPLRFAPAGDMSFADWRWTARAKLRECLLSPPPAAPFVPVVIAREDRDGYEARKIVFNVSADCRVPAYLLVPHGEGPFPAVIALHDHGGNFLIGKEKVVRPFGVSEEVTQEAQLRTAGSYDGRFIGDELAKRGYVVFAMDALFWGERGRREGVDYNMQQALASNLLQMGMTWIGVITWDDVRSAEFVAGLPEVDGSRVGAVGLSMGCHRAWMLAAATDRVAAGVAVCWMGTTEALMSPGNNQVKGHSAYSMLVPNLRNFLDYPDTAAIACPKPMMFFNGEQDGLFPVEGVRGAYRIMRQVWDSQGAGDRLVTKLWPLGHTFNLDMQAEAFAWLDEQLGKVRGEK